MLPLRKGVKSGDPEGTEGNPISGFHNWFNGLRKMNGAARGNRTHDLSLTKGVLYH